LAGKLGQAARPKNDQSHDQDDEHFLVSDAKHERCALAGKIGFAESKE
jgi:hypothetical protein